MFVDPRKFPGTATLDTANTHHKSERTMGVRFKECSLICSSWYHQCKLTTRVLVRAGGMTVIPRNAIETATMHTNNKNYKSEGSIWNDRCGSNECFRGCNSLHNQYKQDQVVSKTGIIGVGPKGLSGSLTCRSVCEMYKNFLCYQLRCKDALTSQLQKSSQSHMNSSWTADGITSLDKHNIIWQIAN